MDTRHEGGKESIRHDFSLKRRELAARGDWDDRCLAVQQALLGSSAWKEAERVVLYASFASEVRTDLLLRQAWAGGKEVFLPRCRPGESGRMDMILCRSGEDLEVSPMGMAEPRLSQNSRFLDGRGKALVVVPALAFDRRGFRLGYGGGYYDRFLDGEAFFSVGLTVRELVAELLPREPWDRPVSALCTEEGMLCLRP